MEATATLTRKSLGKSQRECFEADHAKFNAQLIEWDAVQVLVDPVDGPFAVIDEAKCPAGFASMYQRFLSLGYANGYIR